MNQAIKKTLSKKPKSYLFYTLLFIAFAMSLWQSFQGATINFLRLESLGINLRIMFEGLIDIQWDFFFGRGVYRFTEGVVYLILQTVAIGFIGTLIGTILAVPFGFLASENLMGKKLASFGDFLLTFIRVFPEIILALIIVKGFGINALTGVLTIGLHSVGMIGKLFSESIDNMDRGPIEAIQSFGGSKVDQARYGIIPQVLPEFISIALYRFDINVRSATVLGIIGAGGIGTSLILASENWNWDILGTILLAIVIMVLSIDFISNFLRKKLI
jgi:phosphonate transport system permease protein